jgi:hypothetical protein
MRNRSVRLAMVVMLSVAFVGACTRPGSGNPGNTTTTKQPPATVPISGYFISGSINRFKCNLGACQLQPAKVTVHVMQQNKVVAQANSFDTNGEFTVRVPDAGTYTVHVTTANLTCTTAKVTLTAANPIGEIPDTIVCK